MTELASVLRDYGPWGMLAVSLMAVWHLHGKLEALWGKFLTAVQATAEVIQAYTLVNRDQNAANEARARATEAVATQLAQVANDLRALKSEIEQVRAELRR